MQVVCNPLKRQPHPAFVTSLIPRPGCYQPGAATGKWSTVDGTQAEGTNEFKNLTTCPRPKSHEGYSLSELGKERSRRRLQPEGSEPPAARLALGFVVSVQRGTVIQQPVMGKALVLSLFGGK